MSLAYAASRLQVLVQQIDEGTRDLVAQRRAAVEQRYAPGARYTNWSHLGSCAPERHERPKSIDDVVKIVKKAVQLRQRLRVTGVGHSYNGCQFTDGVMIHMTAHMNRVLSVDASKMTVTCEAGATIADVCDALRLNQLQLQCMPSITNITIGGIIGTGTHGSGINTPSICASVVSMTIVDGRGEIVVIDEQSPDGLLRLASCHLGLLGVVVLVTLKAEKLSVLRAHHAPLPLTKVPSVLAQRVTMNDFYRFWWVPHTDMCYECVANRARPADEEGEEGRASTGARSIQTVKTTASESSPRAKLQAIARVIQRAGGGDNHDMDYREYLAKQKTFRAQLGAALTGNWLRHTVLETSLYAATYVPALQPVINKCYQRIFLSSPEFAQGYNDSLLTFDCLFPQHGIEWAIEAHRALEALELVQQIVRANNLQVHFPVEFRFADADGCGVSPAFDRKTCWVGLVMFRPYLRDAPSTDRYYALFAQGMARLGGRPHWAKASGWTRRNYEQSYGAQFTAFMQLRSKMDPHGLFINDWASTIVNK